MVVVRFLCLVWASSGPGKQTSTEQGLQGRQCTVRASEKESIATDLNATVVVVVVVAAAAAHYEVWKYFGCTSKMHA